MKHFLRRTLAMAAKEVIHIRRDATTMSLALVMPLLLVVLFGVGVSLDIDHVKLVVSDHDRSENSRALVRAFTASGDLDRVADIEPDEAEAWFKSGRASAALIIPKGYEHTALWLDGSDATSANQVLQRADAITRTTGMREPPPLRMSTWTLYNPSGRSSVFIVPGLAGFVLALCAVLLTGLTIAGEWERGSMEQLFASPVGRLDIIVGKLLPYLLLGCVQLLLVLTATVTAFGVPIRGSVFLILPFGLVFLTGMLGQGLLVSVVAKNQLVASQIGLMTALLPSMLLSGMIFPIENMPAALRALSAVIPARYLVHALRGIMLKGQGFGALWQDFAAMSVFTAAILAVATARFKRRLA